MKKNLMDYRVVDIFIGNAIKERRLEKKIGLVEMAKKLGTYKQRYSNFETGSRSFPLEGSTFNVYGYLHLHKSL